MLEMSRGLALCAAVECPGIAVELDGRIDGRGGATAGSATSAHRRGRQGMPRFRICAMPRTESVLRRFPSMRYQTTIIGRVVKVTSPRTGTVFAYKIPPGSSPGAYALRCAERARVSECLDAIRVDGHRKVADG
jgi:hypothetical protein